VYEHFLGIRAPYPPVSWPVLAGMLGGFSLLIGAGMLMSLKWEMDTAPDAPQALDMNVAFLLLLFFTGLTGLLTLLFRETRGMAIVLSIHLGFVLGLFITLPYGKFVHAIYRYLALVWNTIEASRLTKR
jgi:citrate/tricarballylate utilization protein